MISLVVLVGGLVGTSAAAAAPAGALSQLTGADGCLSTSGNTFGCATGSAVKESTSVTVSPDNKNVYSVATNSSGLEVLARDPGTGAVKQLPGIKGCFTVTGTDDNGNADACSIASGLGDGEGSGPNSVTVSPDGKNVYVTNGDDRTIVVFTRDGSDGSLTPVQCLGPKVGAPTGCSSTSRLLSDLHQLVVSADGAHVYAASGEGGGNGAVLLFNRAPGDGTLTPPADATHCVTVTGLEGPSSGDQNPGKCAQARALNEPYGLALSPDGKQLYVAASEGDRPATSDGAVVTLQVQADGSLVQPAGPAGCLSGSGTGDATDPSACAKGKPAHDLNGVAVSPDGTSVYGASAGASGEDRVPPTPGAVEILKRAVATGDLSQDVASKAGCLSADGTDGAHGTADTCDTARGIAETYRITVSPDGGVVYVASQGVAGSFFAPTVAQSSNAGIPGNIGVFSRNSSGALTQLTGADGCVSDDAGNDGQGGTTCAPGRALAGAYQLALSSDCTSAYVASQNAPGLAVFSARPCLPPLADTNPASNVTASSATLNGAVNPRGTSTSAVFEYGTSTAYGTTTSAQDAGAGTSPNPLAANIGGLSAGTTYHFRVVATNAYGRAVGADQVFTTPAAVVASPGNCIVPKLRGKTVAQAKKLLVKRHCKLGKVTRRAGTARRTGPLQIVSQGIRAGRVRRIGTRVAVTLGRTGPLRQQPRPAPRFTG